MEIQQFKLLLKLLDQQNYHGKIAQVKPNSQTSLKVTRHLAQQLKQQKYVDVEEEIVSLTATAKGKKSITQLTNLEQKVINTCLDSAVKPTLIKIKPAKKRDEYIQILLSKKLIKITEKKITNVWLTDQGKNCLAKTLCLQGAGNVNLSKQLLNIYLTFLRGYLLTEKSQINTFKKKEDTINLLSNKQQNEVENAVQLTNVSTDYNKPTEDEVLRAIIELDKETNGDNYLPIFHLRNKYKNTINREALDQILYNLQKKNKLSFSRLVDGSKYTSEQYQAGIPQNVGGPIFYLIVKF